MSLFITMTNALLLKLDFKVGFYKSNYIVLVHVFWLIKNVFQLASKLSYSHLSACPPKCWVVAKSRIKQLSTASADFQDTCVLLEILQASNLM